MFTNRQREYSRVDCLIVRELSRKTHVATKRGIVQDAVRFRKSIAKCFLNAPDYIKFSDETSYFLESLDL